MSKVCSHVKIRCQSQPCDDRVYSVCKECNKVYYRMAYTDSHLPESDPSMIASCQDDFTNNPIICSHELEKPDLQAKDYNSRQICYKCQKVYATHIIRKETAIDNDKQILEVYFGSYNPLYPNCTYSKTGRQYVEQEFRTCFDCHEHESLGACIACLETCHKGHRLGVLKKGHFFCDCAAVDNHKSKQISNPSKPSQPVSGDVICSHKKIIPPLQMSDGHDRSVCLDCKKVYKTNVFSNEVTLESDPECFVSLMDQALKHKNNLDNLVNSVNSDICSHEKIKSPKQMSDGFNRSVCVLCPKVYKTDVNTGEMTLESDDVKCMFYYMQTNMYSIVCSHELETPSLQFKDFYSRKICRDCHKVYKYHVNSNEVSVETDQKIIDHYFGNQSDSNNIDLNHPNCTFGFTGKQHKEQYWKHCYDCYQTLDEGACIACLETCHKGHKLSKMKYSRFYCDCSIYNHSPKPSNLRGDDFEGRLMTLG